MKTDTNYWYNAEKIYAKIAKEHRVSDLIRTPLEASVCINGTKHSVNLLQILNRYTTKFLIENSRAALYYKLMSTIYTDLINKERECNIKDHINQEALQSPAPDPINLLTRLEKFRDNHPFVADKLEEAFPEIKDEEPFVRRNQMFMRSTYPGNIYALRENINNEFYVECLNDGRPWTSVKETDGYNNGIYLTRSGFNSLLKRSGCSLDSIILLTSKDIKALYDLVTIESVDFED